MGESFYLRGAATLTVHLPHGSNVIIRVFKADKAVTLGFPSALVSNHFGLQEGRVPAECPRQDVIIHLITQISTEYPKIIWIEEDRRRYVLHTD